MARIMGLNQMDWKRWAVISALIVPSAASGEAPGQWQPASRASQLEALRYIEQLEVARSAGRLAAADALGVKDGRDLQGPLRGEVRRFGAIELAAELEAGANEPVIVVKVSGGCIDRDVAKASLMLGKVVWAPLADAPAPVIGYAHFQGGSASTVFFDATGSRCLTGVRIEDPARLNGIIKAASAEASLP